LKFRLYEDHLTLEFKIIGAIDGDPEAMKKNTTAMEENTAKIDERQSYLQHLEMARQIEIYSEKVRRKYGLVGTCATYTGEVCSRLFSNPRT